MTRRPGPLRFRALLRRLAKHLDDQGRSDEATKVRSLFRHPVRRSEEGVIADVLEETRMEVARKIRADSTVCKAVRLGVHKVGFDWASVWEWIKAHWLDILKAIASILSIFFLIV